MPNPKLVKREVVVNNEGEHLRWSYWFYCPGCKNIHRFVVGNKTGPNWSFNGDMEVPHFNPSLRYFVTDPETNKQTTTCHLHLHEGKLEYCGDCPHDHNNRKGVPLPEIPEDYSWLWEDKK